MNNVTRYRPSLKGRAWTMNGATERFRGMFSLDGRQLEGEWEHCNSRGVWLATMQVTLTRIST